MDFFPDDAFRALRDLFIAGIIFFSYKTARDARQNASALSVIWKGFLWCTGIALFAAMTVGEPSCEVDGDPIHGGCEQYADDGYEPTTQQRYNRFLYFVVLLNVPVVAAALNEPKRSARLGRQSNLEDRQGHQ